VSRSPGLVASSNFCLWDLFFPVMQGSIPLGCVPLLEPMLLLPRWRFMTDEAKALTKRTAVSALVVLLVLMVFRALVPWVLVVLVGWWVWKAVSK